MKLMPGGAHRVWAALAVLFSLTGPAAAQNAAAPAKIPAPVIAVIDVQGALQQSVAAKGAREQRDRYLQTFQVQQEATRKALKDEEADVVKQRAGLPPEQWQAKARAFEQRVFEFNQRFQKTNQAVEKSFRIAMGELSQALAQVADEVANEMGANLVLPKSQIFLHDPRMEITPLVLERLNRKHTSVTFPAPEIEGQAVPKAPAKKK